MSAGSSRRDSMVEGKVVLVTGAGGGIGRDIALAMARHGARVVVNDIGAALDGAGHSAGPAQQVVDEIHALGGEAVPNADSVADAASAARMVQCAVDNFGRIDAVVNNAGILRDRFFQDRKSTRLNSSHVSISYAVFCLKKKTCELTQTRQDTTNSPQLLPFTVLLRWLRSPKKSRLQLLKSRAAPPPKQPPNHSSRACAH